LHLCQVTQEQPIEDGFLGLDVARFRSNLASDAYAARIEADVQEGIRNAVNATHKFYVNGDRIDGKLRWRGCLTSPVTCAWDGDASR